MKSLRRLLCRLFGPIVCVSLSLSGQERLAAPKPASVEGVVTNVISGVVLADVRVVATPIEPVGPSKTVTTNASGRFSLSGLVPGRYSLDATRTLFFRSRRNAGPLNLTLAADEHLSDIRIRLAPTGVISGRIYDESGVPQRVRVEAVRREYRGETWVLILVAQAQSDDRGEYRIFNLQSGTYYVRAIPPSNNADSSSDAATYFPSIANPQDAAPITVQAGAEQVAMDITLRQIKTVSVKVKLAGVDVGIPQPPVVFVAVDREHGRLISGRPRSDSSSDNTYRFSGLPPGSYEVFARVGSPPDMRTGSMFFEIQDSQETELDAGALVVVPGVTLRGRLTAATPLPRSLDRRATSIALHPLDGAPFATSSRSAGGAVFDDGSFVIPNVGNGRFRVELAGLPPDVYLKSAHYAGRDVIDAPLVIAGDRNGSLELELSGPSAVGSVEGVVRDSKENPMPDSLVVLIPSVQRRDDPSAFKTAITDQRGLFTIKGILPGDYTILAWEDLEPNAYLNPIFLGTVENRTKKVAVEGGSKKVVDIRLIQ